MPFRIYNRPLKPKEAILISLLALLLGLIGAFIAYFVYAKPLVWVLLVTAGFVYIAVSMSWAYLDHYSRDIAMRGHNIFIYFVLAMIILAFLTTKEGQPFPKWQIPALIAAGAVCYSLAGVVAVKNFIRWKKGEF